MNIINCAQSREIRDEKLLGENLYKQKKKMKDS